MANIAFSEAVEIAAEQGFQTYDEWLNNLQLRYERMPYWYWDSTKCREVYARQIATSLRWKTEQEQMKALERLVAPAAAE